MSSAYPRPHRYDLLGPAAKRLARVPRYARLIAMLPPDRFHRLTSEAATFWEVYNYVAVDPREESGLLDDGLKATEAAQFGWHKPEQLDRKELGIRKWQVRLARDLLAVIAFEMFLGSDGQGTSRPMFTVVEDLDEFLNRAFDRFERSGAYQTARKKPIDSEFLWEDWRRLKAMDSHGLKHLVFSATEERLHFTDITTQTFFAAYWACRWSDDQGDRETLRGWLPASLAGTNEAYLEFWRFVTEMPVEATDGARYEALLAPLYDGTWTDEQGLPIRSTELLYRSWKRMRETPAGRTYRGEFRRLHAGTGTPDRVAVARRLLEIDGKSPFLSLCEGARGADDRGQFEMGAPADEAPNIDNWDGGVQNNPVHRVRLLPYRLHRCCVTNAEYELFDLRHKSRRAFQDKVKNTDAHPVVNVSWYDACCFAAWLGPIEVEGRPYEVSLPSEAQWEYACRAGQATPFTWEEGRDGNRIESDYCNFDGNYPWHRPGTEPTAKKGADRNITVQVDGMDENGSRLAPNRWGFCQLHGNVWEWCGDWYERDYYRSAGGKEIADPRGPAQAGSRGLRGGSWIDYGGNCRSAFRYWRSPDFRYGSYGFRLAAVPRSAEVAGGERKERA